MSTSLPYPTSRHRQTRTLSNMTQRHQSHAIAHRHTTSQAEDHTRPA